MKFRDYYEILGVDKTSTQDQIKKAYRKLAKKYHPDANPGDKKAEEKFKEANEANEVLSDPEKRKKYDQFGQNYNFSNGTDFDPSQYGFGGNNGNVRYEYRTNGNNGGDFSDFFDMFFGGSRGGGGFDINDMMGRGQRTSGFGRSYAMNGEDSEAEIEITPEEGFSGTEKRVSLRNSGQDKTISFKIPPGILPNGKIKLSGQGGPGVNGGKNGDLYLVVKFKTGRFQLDGINLILNIDLAPWQAALGHEAGVQTIDGKIIVKIPPGIQTDGKIRVSGKGYKGRNGERGDLYIKIRIINPPKLSIEERELYEKLQEISTFNPTL